MYGRKVTLSITGATLLLPIVTLRVVNQSLSASPSLTLILACKHLQFLLQQKVLLNHHQMRLFLTHRDTILPLIERASPSASDSFIVIERLSSSVAEEGLIDAESTTGIEFITVSEGLVSVVPESWPSLGVTSANQVSPFVVNDGLTVEESSGQLHELHSKPVYKVPISVSPSGSSNV